MNRRLKLFVTISGILVLIAIAFPPWHTVYYGERAPNGRPGPVMWAPLWNPIRMSYAGAFHGDNGGSIAWGRLCLEFVAISIISGISAINIGADKQDLPDEN